MLLTILTYAGLFLFAASGALMGVRRQLDIFGIWTVACITGVGGGMIRDTFLGINPPYALDHWTYIFTCSVATVVVALFHPQYAQLRRTVVVLDAFGMGLFAATGTLTAVNHGTSNFAAFMIGITTAVGGGVLRDVLVNEVPMLVQQRDLYAVPAMAGAAITVAVADLADTQGWALVAGALAASGFRLIAVKYNWTLPMARNPAPKGTTVPDPSPTPPPPAQDDAAIYHLALASDWDAAKQLGEYRISTRGVTLDEEGFIHNSTAAQVDGVASRYYADVDEPLVLLTIDPDAVVAAGVELRYEPPAPGLTEEFPHIYGPIDPNWVTVVTPVVVEGGKVVAQ